MLVGLFAVAVQAGTLAIAWPAAVASRADNFGAEDSHLYRSAAAMIRNRGLFSDDPEIHFDVRVRTIGYPLLILAVDEVAGANSRWLLMILQVAATTLSCVLTSRIAAHGLGERCGRVAGLLAALAPGNNVYTLLYMPEAVSTVFWLASWYMVSRGNRSGSAACFLISGLCLALSAFLKPVFFYCWLPMALVLVVSARKPWRFRGRATVLFLLAFAVGIGPGYARNSIIWDELVFTPQSGSQQYLVVRSILLAEAGVRTADPDNRLGFGVADSRVPGTETEWEQKFGSPWANLAKRHNVFGRLAREDITGRFGLYWKTWAIKQPRLYAGTGVLALANVAEPDADRRLEKPAEGFRASWARVVESRLAWLQVLSWILLLVVYGGAVVGTVALVRRYRWDVVLPPLLLLAYFALTATLVPHTRYRFPMMYPFALLAGAALWAWRPSLRVVSSNNGT
jgi:hypothetical protein